MFPRSLKLRVAAISPLTWGFLAGCASANSAPLTDAGNDAGVVQDVGSPQDSRSVDSESLTDGQLQSAESAAASADSREALTPAGA